MATRVIDDVKLQAIAVAVQGKDNGGVMTVDEMPTRIAAIPSQDMTLIDVLISGEGNITSIESGASSVRLEMFKGFNSLTTAIFPNATSLGVNSMRSCTRLTTIEIPKTIQINGTCFFGCSRLPRIFLQSVTAIGQQIFWNCSALTTVIMGKRATLGNTNSFTNNNAIIYVQPDDLSWYETETNWSTIYAQGKIVAAADHLEHLISIGIDVTDFENEVISE